MELTLFANMKLLYFSQGFVAHNMGRKKNRYKEGYLNTPQVLI